MVLLAALLTHPLLAALVVELHPPGVRAVWGRQAQVIRAERDAADGPIHADALQLARGLEALPVEVDLAQQVTCCALMSWGRKRRRSEQEAEALPWGHGAPEEGQSPPSPALPSQCWFHICLPGPKAVPDTDFSEVLVLPKFSRKISSLLG